MSSSSEVKWLWRMTSTEALFEPYTIGYRLAIATSRPLLEKHFDLALRHLFRKVPSFRVCFDDRDGETWLREMADEIIDLEILPDGQTEDILYIQHHYKYKSTGPLWSVKVKPGEMESSQEFKHVYDLFLGVNHAITDGESNVRICRLLVQLLDAVIAGTPVDDTEQLGVFTSDERTQAAIQRNVVSIEADPQVHSRVREEYEALQRKQSIFRSTFKGRKVEEAKIGIVSREFEGDAMSSFVRRCREEGVTVNSGLTALANLAIVDLLSEGGLLQESYGLRSDHVLNARKYWDGEPSQDLGCHILPLMSIEIETPRNAGETFWRYAESVHRQLKRKLQADKVLQEDAVKSSLPESFTFEMEFGLSNMGDVTPILSEGGQNVRILHLLRSATSIPANFFFFAQTFRGRLTPTLLYNTSIVTSAIAQKFCDLIFDHLKASLSK